MIPMTLEELLLPMPSAIFMPWRQTIMAISILGWPLAKLSADIAGRVYWRCCGDLQISRYSIGWRPQYRYFRSGVRTFSYRKLKREHQAEQYSQRWLPTISPRSHSVLVYSGTASKKNILDEVDYINSVAWMTKLNSIGTIFGNQCQRWRAMTDVTGFGRWPSTRNLWRQQSISKDLFLKPIPKLEKYWYHIGKNCIPGGNLSGNWKSYGEKVEK